MTELSSSLVARIRAYSPGDVLEAAEISEALEKAILQDDTDFDDAALLSRILEEFLGLVKGSSDDWPAFWAGLPAPAPAPRAPVELEVDVEVLASFLSEASEHLESVEERILSLESDPDSKTVHEIFRSLHTIKGVSGFLNLGQIKKLSHELESLLDELRSQARTVDRGLVDVLLLGCDTLVQLVGRVARQASLLTVEKGTARITLEDLPIDEVLAVVSRLRTGKTVEPQAAEPQTAEVPEGGELAEKFSQEALETLEVVEDCLLTMEKTRSTGPYLNEAFRSIHTLKGNAGFLGFEALESLCMEMEALLDALRKGQKAVDAEAMESLLSSHDKLRTLLQNKTPDVGTLPAAPGLAAVSDDQKIIVKKKDVRVDTEKLDTLFDLIGELITAQAMVASSPAAASLSKITRELQAVTMSIRMIPLEGLFSKMNRLVRDLGRKFNKEIELDISGAETEMDRNIIEEVSDPLVHIIRNAIDHGIEDDAVRRQKGKKPGGRIRLNAKYEGNEIWITVADDGAGLDRERILQVARSRGLVTGADPADAEVWNLIFEPGFSTAQTVSEISGRGVGMDVVKKNLEKLRGQVAIHTVRDQGTDFVLKIPLTLAILDGVTLRSGTTLYSIPIADVVEFQNFQSDRITRTDPEHSVLRLRQEVIPVLSLAGVFVSRESGVQGESAKQVSIIVKSRDRKLALVVDEIVGYQQIVLKALPETMAGLQGVSGCAILGTGEVSLIIDVNALFARYWE